MTTLIFTPPLGWVAALLIPAVLLVPVLLALYQRRPRAAFGRATLAAMALLLLLNPQRQREQREPERPVALALIDASPTMALDKRRTQAQQALAQLRASPEGRAVTWQVVEVASANETDPALAAALTRSLARIAPDRLAATLVFSDGLVPPAPLPPALRTPVHILLSGSPTLRDRRVVIEQAPPYTLVGQNAPVQLRVEDGDTASPTTRARLRWSLNGVAQAPLSVIPGQRTPLKIPVTRRGPLTLTVTVEALPGERFTANNTALATLNGVRDRLSVLLLSGSPSLSTRAWRDVLKSDPSIELVHFTILRLPSSSDPTPAEEMALIPFPVEQLFLERLNSFDLVIFERFSQMDLLPTAYLDRLDHYVRGGGGLLVVSGAEFNDAGGLADTMVGQLLPVQPAGPPQTQPFKPTLTALGHRHPITAALPQSWPGGASAWGPWSLLAPAQVKGGLTLMSAGTGSAPLLVIDTRDKGRVAALLSPDAWAWARGVDGGGPRDELVRRLSHWLMQEPDLEALNLKTTPTPQGLSVQIQSLDSPPPLSVTDPAGKVRTLAWQDSTVPGTGTALVATPQAGLYHLKAGPLTHSLKAGPGAELTDIRPRANPLATWAQASGGGVFWLEQGLPALQFVDAQDRAAGPHWLGLRRGSGGRLMRIDTEPLLPPLLGACWLLAAAALAWGLDRR